MATWAEVTALRQSTPPQDSAKLLEELADSGDLDAAIQLELLKLDAKVGSELRPCEAFADALAAIARAVQAQASGPDMLGEVNTAPWDDVLRAKFLIYSWAYLVERGDRSGLIGGAIAPLTGDERVEISGWLSHTAAGEWESVAPRWSLAHDDGGPGTGYMPPRADDAVGDQHGRKAHFLANAQFGYRYGRLGSVPAEIWEITEDSTTDMAVNELGVEFGRALREGDITADNVAAWVRRRLCTEGRCAEGSVSPALMELLRYGLITGEAQYDHEEVHTRDDPKRDPVHSKTVNTREERMSLTARVRLRPGQPDAEFGRAIEGNWSMLVTSTSTGEPDQRRSGSGAITRVAGSLMVDGETAGDYSLSADGEASAAEMDFTTYHFGAGGDGRRLCADESLSGSDSRKKFEEKTERFGDPQDFGELLRGARLHYDVHTTHRIETSWSWKFTFSKAPTPAHVDLCSVRYDGGEVMVAAGAFLQLVMQQLATVMTSMHMSGRAGDADVITAQMTSSYTALADAGGPLHEKSSQIDDGCRRVDDLWLYGTDPGELEYNDALDLLKRHIDDWKNLKEALIDRLASVAEAAADGIRHEDGVAEGHLEALAARLRREGVEAFVGAAPPP